MSYKEKKQKPSIKEQLVQSYNSYKKTQENTKKKNQPITPEAFAGGVLLGKLNFPRSDSIFMMPGVINTYTQAKDLLNEVELELKAANIKNSFLKDFISITELLYVDVSLEKDNEVIVVYLSNSKNKSSFPDNYKTEDLEKSIPVKVLTLSQEESDNE